MNRLERFQAKVTKMTKRLGNLPCEERLRGLDLFSLEKIRFRGNVITMSQYLTGWLQRRKRILFFTRSNMEKPKGDRYKLNLGRF